MRVRSTAGLGRGCHLHSLHVAAAGHSHANVVFPLGKSPLEMSATSMTSWADAAPARTAEAARPARVSPRASNTPLSRESAARSAGSGAFGAPLGRGTTLLNSLFAFRGRALCLGRVTGRPAAEARVRSIVHGARVFDRWGARACAVMTAVRRSEAGLVPGKVAEYHDRDESSTDPIGRLTCIRS